MNWGYGLWAAMESMNAAESQALAKDTLQDLKEVSKRYNRFTFVARSHVHGLRAEKHARNIVEDRLIAALKAENDSHPLASREAVDEMIQKEYEKALFNPEIIKRTYPDGKLPEGAVIPPDKVWTIK